jgi:flagellar assembly protein FliH
MSTSCNPPPHTVQPEARPFPYAELAGTANPASASMVMPTPDATPREALAQNESSAREAGRREGEAQARAAFDGQLAILRKSAGSALAEFARQREAYFRQVEGEVVRLALNIARKILRREAQVDPLLLAGMVRVVLEKIEGGTKVIVRVHPEQVSECRAYFAQHMEPRQVPEVVEDISLPLNQCILQSELGTTELGAEVELKEIEQGLFDLLERRPASKA